MRKTYVLFTLVCACTLLSAQEKESKFSVSAFAAPTMASRMLSASGTYSEVFKEIWNDIEAPKAGYSAGLLAAYAFNKKISLQTGITFTNNGYLIKKRDLNRFGSQFDGTGFNPSLPPEPGMPSDIKFIYHYYYLDIPLHVKYTFFKKGKFGFYVLGGFEANFNLANKQTTISWYDDGEKERETADEELPLNTSFQKVNCSAVAGAGMDVELSPKVSLFVQPTYRQMLLSVVDASVKRRLYSVGLVIGVAVHL